LRLILAAPLYTAEVIQGLKEKVLSKMIFKKRSNAPRVQGPAGQNIDFRIFEE
jgi:hypothetical protein